MKRALSQRVFRPNAQYWHSPAGTVKPWHAEAMPRPDAPHSVSSTFDHTHDLVPENQGNLRAGELSIHNVEVSPADAARPHTQEYPAGLTAIEAITAAAQR